MPRAWIMPDVVADPRAENQLSPPEPVSLDTVRDLGVLYWQLDADNFEQDGRLAQIRKERNYTYQDLCEVHRDTLPDFDKKLEIFFTEHLHRDEEIRFFIGGSGYFDVRGRDDRWVRIACKKGDLIVLPAGIYHRFCADASEYAKVMRLFVGEPVWTPYNRPADEMDVRRKYVDDLQHNRFG